MKRAFSILTTWLCIASCSPKLITYYKRSGITMETINVNLLEMLLNDSTKLKSTQSLEMQRNAPDWRYYTLNEKLEVGSSTIMFEKKGEQIKTFRKDVFIGNVRKIYIYSPNGSTREYYYFLNSDGINIDSNHIFFDYVKIGKQLCFNKETGKSVIYDYTELFTFSVDSILNYCNKNFLDKGVVIQQVYYQREKDIPVSFTNRLKAKYPYWFLSIEKSYVQDRLVNVYQLDGKTGKVLATDSFCIRSFMDVPKKKTEPIIIIE